MYLLRVTSLQSSRRVRFIWQMPTYRTVWVFRSVRFFFLTIQRITRNPHRITSVSSNLWYFYILRQEGKEFDGICIENFPRNFANPSLIFFGDKYIFSQCPALVEILGTESWCGKNMKRVVVS